MRLPIGLLAAVLVLTALALDARGRSGEGDALPVFESGVHAVGDGTDQIAAGRYTTAGPGAGADPCVVARLSGLGGRTDDVITAHAVDGPATLRVRDADAGVALQGPCLWTPAP
ncbi:hypothetical protein [Actinomycetospora cinnamomea]|uniref:Uncharacterized protein n=1 Tax=Actinomycetospora cinnamomea TaxID=663609 RepID=A0A2U1EXD3_9PSEU|nr:hypothetical protein [Actinomycetospora cinnamomea]PVZ04584.1 hypothetical protein C8D89_11737 [Actinomycetospora cinnamomea]